MLYFGIRKEQQIEVAHFVFIKCTIFQSNFYEQSELSYLFSIECQGWISFFEKVKPPPKVDH